MTNQSLLLDTCAIIWLFNRSGMSEESRSAIAEAARQKQLYVSPFSAWEIATLAAKKKIVLTMEPRDWFGAVVAHPGIAIIPLDHEVLIDSCQLADEPPADPADRIVIATARRHRLTVVTRDAPILQYAGRGYLRALAC